MAGNRVITTVCDVLLRDPVTHAARFRGTALSTSAFEVKMSNTDVRGGRNNPLIYKYLHNRDLSINITSVVADKEIIAMQMGNEVTNGTYNVLGTDYITLDSSGNGTLSNTPIGNVDVRIMESNLLVNVTPSAKSISIPSAAGKKVEAMYLYSGIVDRVAFGTTTPPDVVEMYMTGEVRDKTGNIIEWVQFYVPNFQLDGNYKLDFKADGTSTESLTGSALSVDGLDCTSGDVYGYVSWIPNTNTAYAYSDLAVSPNKWTPTHGAEEQTQQLTVKGLRGTALPPTNVTSNCTFTKNETGADTITVSESGLITVSSSAIATDTADITATFTYNGNTFTDTCKVTVV
jgi:hypothetical protein